MDPRECLAGSGKPWVKLVRLGPTQFAGQRANRGPEQSREVRPGKPARRNVTTPEPAGTPVFRVPKPGAICQI
jgi:hypothetical protein